MATHDLAHLHIFTNRIRCHQNCLTALKLKQLIERLKPSDLLNRARAVVLNRMPGVSGWDFADGEDDEGEAIKPYEKADKMALEIGRALANDAASRAEFLAELLVLPQALRAFECGRGLAEGADDFDALWHELQIAFGASDFRTRSANVLAGFIFEAHQRDHSFSTRVLDAAINNSDLLPILPFLHTRIGIDAESVARLRRAISEGGLLASNFRYIANNSGSKSPPKPLAALLEDIATLPEGVEIALEILHMHFFCRKREEQIQPNEPLVSVGRDLLVRVGFDKDSSEPDYAVGEVIRICLVGEDGRDAAQNLCVNIRSALDSYSVSSHNLGQTLNALFEIQPFVALDTFFLPTLTRRHGNLFDGDFGMKSPIENLDPSILQKWASFDPETRYPLLGKCLSMFTKDGDEEKDLSPVFVSMLAQAPDKQLFFGDLCDRLHPRSWSGSLADILIQRKALVIKLAELADEQVQECVTNAMPELDLWIEQARGRDRASEESFE